MRPNNNFSTVEASAIQIGLAPWKPVLYKLAHRRGKLAINKLALDKVKSLRIEVNDLQVAHGLGFRALLWSVY